MAASSLAMDLHIHSALSPCGSEEMTPPLVLMTAEQQGLQVVGIVDHSTGQNGWAFWEAAPAFSVWVWAGLEVESKEGVHLIALFDDREALQSFERLIAQHLPHKRNRPEILGKQLLLNEWGDVIGEEERLLLAATDMSLERIADITRDYGGLSIAAHIDRTMNGLLPVLGFIPPHLRVDLLELSKHWTRAQAYQQWPELRGWPLVLGSDAHQLDEIGSVRTILEITPPRASYSIRQWGALFAEALRNKENA